MLAPAHRGVIHVRGKDCVHPDIGRWSSRQDDLFSCPGERTTGAHGPCCRHGLERSSLVMTAHRMHPPARAMRENADIDQLRRQAKELMEAYRAQVPDA